jgi:hypothetical protein
MNLIKRQTAPSQVEWIAPPMFEYDANVIHTQPGDLAHLDACLNMWAEAGWRVHTCQRIGEHSYFVLLDRLKREEAR